MLSTALHCVQAEEAQAHAQAVAEAEQAAQAAREDYRGGMSALQHLLSKIGSGIDEAGFVSLVAGPGAGAKARYKEIVDRMVAPESDAHLVTALEDLSTALSMANEVSKISHLRLAHLCYLGSDDLIS